MDFFSREKRRASLSKKERSPSRSPKPEISKSAYSDFEDLETSDTFDDIDNEFRSFSSRVYKEQSEVLKKEKTRMKELNKSKPSVAEDPVSDIQPHQTYLSKLLTLS